MALTPDNRKMLEEASQRFDSELKKREKQERLTENNNLISSLSAGFKSALNEFLNQLKELVKFPRQELIDTVKQIKIEVPEIKVPEAKVDVKIPEIKVPEPKVEVKIPEIKVPKAEVEVKIPPIKVPKPEVKINIPAFPKIPDLKWPKTKMPITGDVGLNGVDLENPLPVQLRDSNGRPVSLENLNTIISSGGGTAKIVKVSEILKSTAAYLIDADGNYRGTIPISGSVTVTATDLDIRDLDASQDNVSISDGTNELELVKQQDLYNAANHGIIIYGVDDGTPQRYRQLRMNSEGDIHVVLSEINDVEPAVNSGVANTGTLRIVHATDVGVSTSASQAGTWNITTLTGITNTVAAAIVNSTGVQYSGSNPVPTQLIAPTTVYSGLKTTTAGAAVALGASTTIKSITVKAHISNTNVVYLGASGFTAETAGFRLSAGDTVSMDIGNLATVFLDVATSGEGISYLAVN